MPTEKTVKSFTLELSRTVSPYYGGSPTPTPTRPLYSTYATLELANAPFEIQRNVLGIWLTDQLAPLVGPEAAELLEDLLTTPERDTVQAFVEHAVNFRIEQELGGCLKHLPGKGLKSHRR